MNSKTDIEAISGGWGIVRTIARRFACIAILTVVFASPGYGYAWYSGTSVGSNGIVYGWGFTDAHAHMYVHTAYVTTTLRSPNGRVASSGRVGAFNTVQSNVYLVWNSNDLGNYTVTSSHEFNCTFMGPVYLGNSNASDTAYVFTVSFSSPTVQPDGIGGNATTQVTVQTNPPVSRAVTLQDVRLTNTGGHLNHPLPNSAVTGTFPSGATGYTDSAGRLQRNYKASIFSGRHDIRATMNVGTWAATLDVKVLGLGQLTAGANYIASNSPAGQIAHPNNWWGTSTTLSRLGPIAQAYSTRFPGAVLGYNDISLPWGGKFDGNSYNWTGGHIEHRLGTNIDVTYCGTDTTRADYVSPDRRDDIVEIFSDNGMLSHEDECAALAHWHMRF